MGGRDTDAARSLHHHGIRVICRDQQVAIWKAGRTRRREGRLRSNQSSKLRRHGRGTRRLRFRFISEGPHEHQQASRQCSQRQRLPAFEQTRPRRHKDRNDKNLLLKKLSLQELADSNVSKPPVTNANSSTPEEGIRPHPPPKNDQTAEDSARSSHTRSPY
jgi:hypothetical protein